MSRLVEPASPKSLFEHLLAVIPSQRFLKKQGLGNEVPFFICPFDVKDAVAIDAMRTNLVSQLKTRGVRVLDINLYDLSVTLLRERGAWDDAITVEPGASKPEFLEMLQGTLDPETHLVPAIARQIVSESFEVLFLSGIGEVYPFIRSHNVLHSLQSKAKDQHTHRCHLRPLSRSRPSSSFISPESLGELAS